MERDKTIQKGDFVTSDGPRITIVDRKDLIKKGVILTLDCPIAREPTPTLEDIHRRLRRLQ